MTLADVDRPSVEAAMDEFERVGRGVFLRKAGFGRARTYFAARGDQLYDSKALMGYAHGLATGTFLKSQDFTGGEQTVAARLRTLGLEVRKLVNPDWTRDEITLACELVMDNAWHYLTEEDPKVHNLSALLQSPAIFPLDERGPDFRNHAGVARKTADIATHHPDYRGAPTNGNKLDVEVLNEYFADPDGMRAKAAAIREALTDDTTEPLSSVGIDLDDVAAEEGGVLMRRHLRYERNRKLRAEKISSAKKHGIAIACEVCGFDFEQVYGDRGRDYIECHHRTPLHVTGKTRTKLDDLALICSNCHRMIHRTSEWLHPQQLKEMVDRLRQPSNT